jgi:hypothetical protein
LNYSNLNDYSIGIETNMPNYARALDYLRDPNISLDFNYFDPYESKQMLVLACLVKNSQEKFNISPRNIIAHSDITPWRFDGDGAVIMGKTDPGPTFPWQQFARQNITVWPKETAIDHLKRTPAYVDGLLHKIGYQDPINEASRNLTYKAAAYRFFPECYDSTGHSAHRCGELNNQFIRRLENMVDGNFIEPSDPAGENLYRYLLIGLASVAALVLVVVFASRLYRAYKKNNDSEESGESHSLLSTVNH